MAATPILWVNTQPLLAFTLALREGSPSRVETGGGMKQEATPAMISPRFTFTVSSLHAGRRCDGVFKTSERETPCPVAELLTEEIVFIAIRVVYLHAEGGEKTTTTSQCIGVDWGVYISNVSAILNTWHFAVCNRKKMHYEGIDTLYKAWVRCKKHPCCSFESCINMYRRVFQLIKIIPVTYQHYFELRQIHMFMLTVFLTALSTIMLEGETPDRLNLAVSALRY